MAVFNIKEFDCNFCETKTIFGEAGSCNVSNPLKPFCECPEGFYGKDDWLSYSGCNVHKNTQNVFHWLVGILSGIGLVVSIVCFLVLLKKWNFRILPLWCRKALKSTKENILEGNHNTSIQKGSVEGTAETMLKNRVSVQRYQEAVYEDEETAISIYKVPEFLKYKYNSDVYKLAVRNWKRRVCVLYAILFFASYFVGGLIYNIPFILYPEVNKSESTILVIGIYIILSGSYFSAVLLILIWHFTLPDIYQYGKLLQINEFLIRFPNYIIDSFTWGLIFLQLVFLVTALIIPLSTTDFEILRIADLITLAALNLVILLCLINFIILIRNVQYVFQLAINMKNSSNNQLFDSLRQEELKFMKSAMVPVIISKWACIAAMTFDLLLELFNLFTGSTENYIYINMNFTMYCIMLGTMPIAFVIMEDLLVPRALHSSHKDQKTKNKPASSNNHTAEAASLQI